MRFSTRFAIIRDMFLEVSRRTNFVKIKDRKSGLARSLRPTTLGAVDLHFHGAFGIDVSDADESNLNDLSSQLWKNGVAGFCPTTISAPSSLLRNQVKNLGNWIRRRTAPGAIPLGIHLEGPFIAPECKGAHPIEGIRNGEGCLNELEDLWEASQQTLKILTVAPEQFSRKEIVRLSQWSKQRNVCLSLGHSHASEQEATEAFETGFRGVTHAWNALPFHHRAPGVMGAALGRKDTYLELIIDQAHVNPTLILWTLEMHSKNHVCFVSDCLLAGGAKQKSQPRPYSLAGNPIHLKNGACRFLDGSLAGGGYLLPESFVRWIEAETLRTQMSIQDCLKLRIRCMTSNPLSYLGIEQTQLKERRIQWDLTDRIQFKCLPF